MRKYIPKQTVGFDASKYMKRLMIFVYVSVFRNCQIVDFCAKAYFDEVGYGLCNIRFYTAKATRRKKSIAQHIVLLRKALR